MENNTMNQDYVNAMNNLENSIQDGLANIPEMPELPAVNPCNKSNVASGILLGVAGAGTVAIAAWAVFGGIKLGKFIKAKAIAKKAKNCRVEDNFDDDFIDEVDEEVAE